MFVCTSKIRLQEYDLMILLLLLHRMGGQHSKISEIVFSQPTVTYSKIPSLPNQGCKKIIDLDLKDRDHLIDLDLLGDLDHYW